MKHLVSLVLLLLAHFYGFAQNHHQRHAEIDVQHYCFEIHLNDTTDVIEGIANIEIKFLKSLKIFTLDLIQTLDKKGMSVTSVKCNNSALPFSHQANKLHISLPTESEIGQLLSFEVCYSGRPADGLVISKNAHGERTFFGDNWPDRAQHWLPCIDHPSDKASLEFKVYAPSRYKVIANGNLHTEKNFENNVTFTHWKEAVPLSTKLMVIGVADFAIGNQESYNGIPVSSWVFKKDTLSGFENYQYGIKALDYFSDLIGPYAYEKLAHVQSKTRYGGMENASCIFYHENTARSERSQEGLFAHEVAHQWFGNSVTEQNWHHVWLSEGFATYLTHVYNQHFYGEEEFREGLKNDRVRVIRLSKHHHAPIIDTTVTEYIRLLNANSYQKASWFLHMLRNKLGDEHFFKGLREYYAQYKNSTALTNNFQKVMEQVSEENLGVFFEQWLKKAGHPCISYHWSMENNLVKLTIKQTQPSYVFNFPIEIKLSFKNNQAEIRKYRIYERETTILIRERDSIELVQLDPNTNLLFEHSFVK